MNNRDIVDQRKVLSEQGLKIKLNASDYETNKKVFRDEVVLLEQLTLDDVEPDKKRFEQQEQKPSKAAVKTQSKKSTPTQLQGVLADIVGGKKYILASGPKQKNVKRYVCSFEFELSESCSRSKIR